MGSFLGVGKGVQAIPGAQIPSEWSQQWFIQFITTWLAPADVRNATGQGINIQGQGTTPATLSTVGYTGAVTISGTTLNFSNGLLTSVTT